MTDDVTHVSSRPDAFAKVRFALEVDADGWPPVSSEGLWAEPLGGDRYRIDNTPWFVRGVASDDVVSATAEDDGVLWATQGLSWSGRLTIRVIPFRAGPLAGSSQAVLDAFEPLGVTGEGAEPAWPIVALDLPPHADLARIKALLRDGQLDGRWEYEEGCVSDEWLDL